MHPQHRKDNFCIRSQGAVTKVPFQMPTRLADGLGPVSDPCERLPAPYAPSPDFSEEFGSPVAGFLRSQH
jgi:hypothetical protein